MLTKGEPMIIKTYKPSKEEKLRLARLKALEWGWVPPQPPAPVVKPSKPKKTKYRKSVAVHQNAKDSFLRTFEWRKVRMQALKKYGAKCMCCGATPATGAVMNVDHIKPRKLWPSLALDINNLQILCHDCNHGKGNWDMTDWRKVNPIAFPK